MLLQPYRPEDLTSAWCYRVYYRGRTLRRRAVAVLPEFTAETLNQLMQPYGLRVLELATDPIEVRTARPHGDTAVSERLVDLPPRRAWHCIVIVARVTSQTPDGGGRVATGDAGRCCCASG